VSEATNNLAALQADREFGQMALFAILQQDSNTMPALYPIDDTSVDEGSAVSLAMAASDTDPGQTLNFSLDPGAPHGAHINPNTGVFTWTATAPGQYSVTIRVTDNGSPAESDSQSFMITVNNVAPTVSAGSNATLVQGAMLIRSGSFVDPGSEVWTATVDYGDGTAVRPLVLETAKTFLLNHAYTASGTYVVTVTVDDGVGGLGTSRFAVNVGETSSGFGPRHDAFVTKLYREQLGRFPEFAGLRYWSGKLATGMRRRTVATGIWRSREHRMLVRQHVAPAITLRRSFFDSLRAWRQAERASHPTWLPSAT
jgi:hypothetical protein